MPPTTLPRKLESSASLRRQDSGLIPLKPSSAPRPPGHSQTLRQAPAKALPPPPRTSPPKSSLPSSNTSTTKISTTKKSPSRPKEVVSAKKSPDTTLPDAQGKYKSADKSKSSSGKASHPSSSASGSSKPRRPRQCSLCGLGASLRPLLTTPCSHAFCAPCVVAALAASSLCPACQRPGLSQRDLRLATPIRRMPKPPALSLPPTPRGEEEGQKDRQTKTDGGAKITEDRLKRGEDVGKLEARVAELAAGSGEREACLREEIRRLSAALLTAKALKSSLADGANLYDLYDVADSSGSSGGVYSGASEDGGPPSHQRVSCPVDDRGRLKGCQWILEERDGDSVALVTAVMDPDCPLRQGDHIFSMTSGEGSEVVWPGEMEVSLARSSGRPVLLEVERRRPPTLPLPPLPPSASQTTIATQTDPVSDEDDEEDAPLLPPHAREEMEALELEADGFIDDAEALEDECQETLCHVEYEEISLERGSSAERLGLTLCYGTGDDVETDIFVSEVESVSVAGRDGRIKPGDQILQINAVDVMTRNQAMELFRARSPTVRLLLARTALEPQPQPPTPTLLPKRRIHVAVEEEEAEAEAELAGLAAEEAQEGGRSDGRSDGAGSAQKTGPAAT